MLKTTFVAGALFNCRCFFKVADARCGTMKVWKSESKFLLTFSLDLSSNSRNEVPFRQPGIKQVATKQPP